MMHKKPTEQVVAATYSAQGLSSSNPHKSASPISAQTLAGSRDESKPITNADQESFVSRFTPEQFPEKRTKPYFKLLDHYKHTFQVELRRLWALNPPKETPSSGSYKGGPDAQRALLTLFKALVRQHSVYRGGLTAANLDLLQDITDLSRRTIQRCLRLFELYPSLMQVLRLEPGDVAYDGDPARRQHHEYRLGAFFLRRPDVAINCLPVPGSQPANFAGSSSCQQIEVSPRPYRSVITTPDLSWITDHTNTPDQKLKPKKNQPRLPSSPNFLNKLSKKPPPISKTNSTLHPSTLRATASKRTAPSKQLTPLRTRKKDCGSTQPITPNYPSEVVSAITQHRQIAENKGPYVPIDSEEVAVVAEAWNQLPERDSVRRKLELCAEVSRLALADSQRNGRPTATLRFTFAQRTDGQSPFLERVTRLREERLARDKTRFAESDAHVAHMIFGTPAVKTAPTYRRTPVRKTRPQSAVRAAKPQTEPDVAGLFKKLEGTMPPAIIRFLAEKTQLSA